MDMGSLWDGRKKTPITSSEELSKTGPVTMRRLHRRINTDRETWKKMLYKSRLEFYSTGLLR